MAALTVQQIDANNQPDPDTHPSQVGRMPGFSPSATSTIPAGTHDRKSRHAPLQAPRHPGAGTGDRKEDP